MSKQISQNMEEGFQMLKKSTVIMIEGFLQQYSSGFCSSGM
jgi:hypothetical protein